MHLQSFCFVSLNIFNFCHFCYPCIMICLAVAINSREKWWKRGLIVLLLGPFIDLCRLIQLLSSTKIFCKMRNIFVRNEGEEELKESKKPRVLYWRWHKETCGTEKYYHYSLKIFLCFRFSKIPSIIYYNQLLTTKFGRILRYVNNDVNCAAWLPEYWTQIGETFHSFQEEKIGELLAKKVTLRTAWRLNSTDDICYLKNTDLHYWTILYLLNLPINRQLKINLTSMDVSMF